MNRRTFFRALGAALITLNARPKVIFDDPPSIRIVSFTEIADKVMKNFYTEGFDVIVSEESYFLKTVRVKRENLK